MKHFLFIVLLAAFAGCKSEEQQLHEQLNKAMKEWAENSEFKRTSGNHMMTYIDDTVVLYRFRDSMDAVIAADQSRIDSLNAVIKAKYPR